MHRSIAGVVLVLPLVGCAGAAPLHVLSAPTSVPVESLACAEAKAAELGYGIYGHTARGTGFTAEKRVGLGYAGTSVSRDILLVDLRTEPEPVHHVTATRAESLTASGRPGGGPEAGMR